jgi:acyl-coenzyme A thioesterase PaaI-like protein
MNVFELPFNKYIGLEKSSNPDYLLMLNDKKEYLNHLETVHASALFALAEATSGYFLLNEFQSLDNILPVVRTVETKYKKPAQGVVFSKATFVEVDKEKVLEELNTRQRMLIMVRVQLYDSLGNNVMQSDFQWFIAKNNK